MVYGLNEVDDVDHGAVGHGRGDVAGHGVFQCGPHVGLTQFLFPGAFAVENIAVTLYHNPAVPQHIGELAYFLGVSDGLIEGGSEIVGTENRQVRVVGFQLFIGVTVDHSQIVIIIFLADEAAGVLAEGAHLVAEGVGIADEFGLIKDFVDFFHDFVADFYSDADIHGAGTVGNVVAGAHFFQFVGATAAGGNNYRFRFDFPAVAAVGLVDDHPFAAGVFQNDIGVLIAEEDLHAVIQKVLFNVVIEFLSLFRTEVADGAVHQLQTGLNGAFADVLDFLTLVETFDVFIGAEFKVDPVGVVDELLGVVFADEAGQVAADFVA